MSRVSPAPKCRIRDRWYTQATRYSVPRFTRRTLVCRRLITMSDLGNYYVVPRKPVPSRTGSSLRVAPSPSTLWRPWSPKLGSLAEYERSLHKFSWLSDERDYGMFYEDVEGCYSPVSQLSSHLRDDSARGPDMAEVDGGPPGPTTSPDNSADSSDDDNLVDYVASLSARLVLTFRRSPGQGPMTQRTQRTGQNTGNGSPRSWSPASPSYRPSRPLCLHRPLTPLPTSSTSSPLP